MQPDGLNRLSTPGSVRARQPESRSPVRQRNFFRGLRRLDRTIWEFFASEAGDTFDSKAGIATIMLIG
jgi:hypothetical protein